MPIPQPWRGSSTPHLTPPPHRVTPWNPAMAALFLINSLHRSFALSLCRTCVLSLCRTCALSLSVAHARALSLASLLLHSTSPLRQALRTVGRVGGPCERQHSPCEGQKRRVRARRREQQGTGDDVVDFVLGFDGQKQSTKNGVTFGSQLFGFRTTGRNTNFLLALP
jgi:hypothetical protein